MAEPRHFSRLGPAIVAVAVALVCVTFLVLLVRDRWIRPDVKPPELAQSTATGQAANSAGAKVMPTEPKLTVEPKPAAPPPVQPANPN
jgi:type IV secretory pathway VirB10-like protein